MVSTYTHVSLEIQGAIGIIKLNRPEALNAWNDTLITDMVTAFRELHENPLTIFTVLTGEGRFFSAGADIREDIKTPPLDFPAAQRKLFYMREFSREMELFRSMIDHRKVFVLAMNGSAVGGGAAWFHGIADIIFAAAGAYMQAPFSSLGLVPEYGAVRTFSDSIGAHRANEFLMFGRKCSVEEMKSWGLVNHIFPAEGFHEQVVRFLQEQLAANDGMSMIKTKELQNVHSRNQRMLAMFDAAHALAERFVEGVPLERFRSKAQMLLKASSSRATKAKASL